MKYLKKFNEELKSNTYRSASQKLKSIGHPRRSVVMSDWANEVMRREDEARELEIYNYYKPYGSFQLDIYKNKYDQSTKQYYDTLLMSGNFIITCEFESDWAHDMFCDNLSDENKFEYGFSLPFELGIIPADDETRKLFKEKEQYLSDEVYDGMYWCGRIWIPFIEKDKFEVNPSKEYSFEAKENDKIVFRNRAEAMKFKKLFSDSIDDKNKWGSSKWSPDSLGEKIKKFINRKPTDRISQEEFDTLMDGAYEKVVSYVKKMSLNQLYRN